MLAAMARRSLAMKPVTEKLVLAFAFDMFPESPAVRVDFGLDGAGATKKFGALQAGWRRESFSEEELDAALGNGPALTALVARGGSTVVFTTAWDDLPDEEDEDDEQAQVAFGG